jgi:hypothetical protein
MPVSDKNIIEKAKEDNPTTARDAIFVDLFQPFFVTFL